MKDLKKFYAIPNYKNYLINALGEIYDPINNKYIESFRNDKKLWCVNIDGNELEIARLVLLRFYGDGDGKFEISYKYSKKEYSYDMISYKINIVEKDDNTIYVNGVEFKRYNDTYYISSKGLVFHASKNNIIPVHINKKGYSQISPDVIHRAVYKVWKGDIPEGLTINHKDGNKCNNDIDNLEAITNSENIRHAFETGLQPSARWKESQVYQVCGLLEKNTQFKEIANTLGCFTDNDQHFLRRLIYRLRYDTAWKDISAKFNIKNYDYENDNSHRSISVEIVYRICELLESGLGNIEVSNKLNVKPGIVKEIRNGVTYKNISSKYDIPSIHNNPNDYKSASRKLNDNDVHEICKRLEKGELCTPIANDYTVSITTINDIKSGIHWTHVSSLYTFPEKNKKFLDEDTIREICKMLESGLNNSVIIEKIGVGLTTLTNIRNGKYFKNISSQYNIPSKNNTSIDYLPATKKLKDSDVHEICKRLLLNESSKVLGVEYKVSTTTIDDIKHKRCWIKISNQYF
jgi:hypothetical protein